MAGPIAGLAVCGAAVLSVAAADAPGLASSFPAPVPAVSDYQLLTANTAPPTEAACFAVGRRTRALADPLAARGSERREPSAARALSLRLRRCLHV